jgi:hypothetical protein
MIQIGPPVLADVDFDNFCPFHRSTFNNDPALFIFLGMKDQTANPAESDTKS